MTDYVMIFVKSAEFGPAIQEAYEALTSVEGCDACKWLTESECMDVTDAENVRKYNIKAKKMIFIFEEFGTPAFRHIDSIRIKIYGPLCVLTSLKNSEPLPKESPRFSMSMSGLHVAFSNVPKKRRDEQWEKIVWMFGSVSKDFHAGVTHLVAGEVGSAKYRVAVRLKKQIMVPDWVDAVWSASHTQLLSANDPAFMHNYRCPVFQGCCVTASGFDSKERNKLRDLITSEGGRYSGEMRIKENTHLVIQTPRGQKYEFAKKWALHIVTPQWVFDCIEKGHCLDEKLYSLQKDSGDRESFDGATSTPTESRGKARPRSLVPDDMSMISVTTVNDTAMTTLNASLGNQSADHRASTGGSSRQSQVGRRQSQVGRKQSQVGTAERQQDLVALDALSLDQCTASNFLDGCKIFLSGFSGARLEKLRKIINMGGASRFSSINESVSHVVVGELVPEHVQLITQLAVRPHTVTVQWLLQSLYTNRSAEESLFLPPDVALPEAEDEVAKQPVLAIKRSSHGSAVVKEESFHAPGAKSRGATRTDEKEDDMEELLSQYLPQKQTSSLGESTLLQAAAMMDEPANQNRAQPKVGGVKPEVEGGLAAEDMETQDPNNFTLAADDEADGGVFAKKSFVIIGFDDQQQTDLVDYIREHGGRVEAAAGRNIPDFAVVPIMGYPVTRTVNEIVTNAYVQMCVEQGGLQPVSDNPLYAPIEAVDETSRPLEGCVISISGHQGTEREALVHVAMLLGATCQDFMVRKANAKKGLLVTTHLVVNTASGSKFEAARKWKLPAVSKRWLIECARRSQRLPEEDFDIERESLEPAETRLEPGTSTPGTRLEPGTSTPGTRIEPGTSTPGTRLGPGTSTPATRIEPGTSTPCTPEGSKADVAKRGGLSGKQMPSPATTPRSLGLIPALSPVNNQSARSSPVDGTVVTQPSGPVASDDAFQSAVAQQQARRGEQNGAGNKRGTPACKATETLTGPPVKNTPVNTRVQKLISENRRSVSHGQKTPEPEGRTNPAGTSDDTPSKLTPSKFGIGAVFVPKYDFGDFDPNAPDTPEPDPPRGYRKRKSSLPLDELFAQHVALALEQFQPIEEGKGTVKYRNVETPGAAPSPAVHRQMCSQSAPLPLRGVVIAVAKKLSAKQTEYNKMAESLGGDYRWTYDSGCTHYIFQGRQNDTNREFREARRTKKHIVSSHWLQACREENRRVDESLYPHTFNPQLALDISGTQTPVRPKRSTRLGRSRGGSENVPPESSDSDTTSRRSTRGGTRLTSQTSHTDSSDVTAQAAYNSRASNDQNKEVSKSRIDDEMAQACGAAEKQEAEAGYVDDLRSLMAAKGPSTSGPPSHKLRRKSRTNNASFETSAGADENSRDSSLTASGSRRPASRSSNSRLEDDEGPSSSGKKRAERRAPQPTPTQAPEASQYEVGWDDPAARAQMEMLAGDLAKHSESVSPQREADAGVDTPDRRAIGRHQSRDSVDEHLQILKRRVSVESKDSGPIPTPDPPSFAMPMPRGASKLPTPQPIESIAEEAEEGEGARGGASMGNKGTTHPVFVFSGIGRELRDDYGALVEARGGSVLDTQYFDAQVTHLVADVPSRSEKFLASVAHGNWVLHKAYLEACRNTDSFPQEEAYEMGAAETLRTLKSASHVKLATAARRWRQHVSQTGKFAFDGWRVLLLSKKSDQFVRLLEAGGAEILATKPPYRKDQLSRCTHALCDPKLVSKYLTQQDLISLIDAGAACVKPEFLSEALVEETPDVRGHHIPEVEQLLRR